MERSSGAAPPRQTGGSDPLAIEIEHRESGVSIVSLIGELDLSTVPIAERPLLGELETHGDVVADLTRLSFIDSSGIALLIRAFRANGGTRLHTVISRDSQVERVFRLAGIDRALPLYFGLAEALTRLNGRAG